LGPEIRQIYHLVLRQEAENNINKNATFLRLMMKIQTSSRRGFWPSPWATSFIIRLIAYVHTLSV